MTKKEITTNPIDIFILYPEYNVGESEFKKVLDQERWVLTPDTLFDAFEKGEPIKNDCYGVREEVMSIKGTEQEKKFSEAVAQYIIDNINEEEFQHTMVNNVKRLIQFSIDISKEAYDNLYRMLLDESKYEAYSNKFVRLLTEKSEMMGLVKMILKIDEKNSNEKK